MAPYQTNSYKTKKDVRKLVFARSGLTTVPIISFITKSQRKWFYKTKISTINYETKYRTYFGFVLKEN